MLLTLALLAAPAQCPNGVCPVGPVGRTVRYVASVPARLTAMPVPMGGIVWDAPKTPATASMPETSPKAGGREFVSLRRAGTDRWYLGRYLFRQFR